MTTEVTIDATYGGKPLEVLGDFIAKREKYLKGETTEKATIATAINVLTSIKAETKVAPEKPNSAMFKVEQMSGFAGWRGGNGNRRRTAIGSDGHRVPGVFPVNNMYGLKGDGNLYKITLTNKNLAPVVAKNAPHYFIMAPNMSVAVKFAERIMERALKRERGLARMALGYAQAKVSNKPMSDTAKNIANLGRVIATVAEVEMGGSGSSGEFWLRVKDDLNYSVAALKNGGASLEIAMMRAANRTAAIINKIAGYRLDEEIPTPFPEVSRK